jgi:hypothetical protein
MALTSERTDSLNQVGQQHTYPVAATAVIYQAAMVGINAGGFLVPMSTALGLASVGVSLRSVDNSGGADGDLKCLTIRGVYAMDNSAGGDEITRADIGSACFAVDDRTVAKTDAGTRSAAGVVHDLNADGLFIRFE